MQQLRHGVHQAIEQFRLHGHRRALCVTSHAGHPSLSPHTPSSFSSLHFRRHSSHTQHPERSFHVYLKCPTLNTTSRLPSFASPYLSVHIPSSLLLSFIASFLTLKLSQAFLLQIQASHKPATAGSLRISSIRERCCIIDSFQCGQKKTPFRTNSPFSGSNYCLFWERVCAKS